MPRIKAEIADSLRFDGQLVIRKLECEFPSVSIARRLWRCVSQFSDRKTLRVSKGMSKQSFLCVSIAEEEYWSFITITICAINLLIHVFNKLKFFRNTEEAPARNKNKYKKDNKLYACNTLCSNMHATFGEYKFYEILLFICTR